VSTADPDYYKWDQWIFLKMFEKGLAYQKESAVNWCPSCKTVLANEQAQNGTCDRCETKVEIKHLKQWFLKITDYADRLLEGHKKLDWPQRTIAMQKNWIGKSHGTEIEFEINGKSWPIFTTRPDTIFGVTFMVVSAQHQDLMGLVTKEQKQEVETFLKKLKSVSEKELENLEKEGVFTGSYAINPADGEKVPVYAGNFVVADYAGGMVMAVPAHDQRDFEFAKKYKIDIKQVIEGELTKTRAYSEGGNLVNSQDFNGLDNQEAKKKITDWLIKEKKARRVINYKLRDWGISRQRYWGTPIPIIYCKKCGSIPVPEKELPVKLPKEVKFGEGNPLETNENWIKTKCPKCGGEARRETDTMDTFVNSSWYFLRYCDPHNNTEIFDKKKVKEWLPVGLYIGGAEHACMHLIYSRFYTMFLKDLGLINFEEFAPRLFHQGMVNAEGGEKMSKSKGNVVLPETVSEKYGIDTARYFLASLASPDKNIDWSDKGISGSLRFVKKIFNTYETIKKGKDSEEMIRKLNNSTNNVSKQIENLEYRKASIELKELFDLISKQKEVSKQTLENSLKLLSPFCPHIAVFI
jgi:leucyl-tRNA synthetase